MRKLTENEINKYRRNQNIPKNRDNPDFLCARAGRSRESRHLPRTPSPLCYIAIAPFMVIGRRAWSDCKGSNQKKGVCWGLCGEGVRGMLTHCAFLSTHFFISHARITLIIYVFLVIDRQIGGQRCGKSTSYRFTYFWQCLVVEWILFGFCHKSFGFGWVRQRKKQKNYKIYDGKFGRYSEKRYLCTANLANHHFEHRYGHLP